MFPFHVVSLGVEDGAAVQFLHTTDDFGNLARSDESDVLMRLLAARIRFMTRCSTWQLHGAGWMNRIAGQLAYGAEDTQ